MKPKVEVKPCDIPNNPATPSSPKSSPKSSLPSTKSASFIGRLLSRRNSKSSGIMGQKVSLPEFGTSFQVVMVGLDNAGKSTSLYRLRTHDFVQTAPTIGFNCEKFKPPSGKAKGCVFTVWDVGGQEKIRPLWRSYIRHTDAIVYVVDSTDADRFEEAKIELSNLLRCSDLPTNVPILLLANKQDLPQAKNEQFVARIVGVNDLPVSHPSHVISCCAVSGEGLDDTFDTLYELIHKARKLDKGSKGKRITR